MMTDHDDSTIAEMFAALEEIDPPDLASVMARAKTTRNKGSRLLDAEPVRLTAIDWHDSLALAPSLERSKRRTPMVLAMACVLLLVAGLAALVSQRGQPLVAGFVPVGHEYVMAEASLADLPPYNSTHVAQPGSVSVGTVAGAEGWLISYQTADYSPFTGSVEKQQCTGYLPPGGGLSTSCGPLDDRLEFGSWNEAAWTEALVGWTDLPAGTAFVAYVDGAGKQRWQRPVGPMAFFPRAGDLGHMTAYDAEGNILQTVDRQTQERSVTDTYPVALPHDSLTEDQRSQLFQLARRLTRSCLDQAGATYPTSPMFPILPSSAGPDIFDECVSQARHAVDQQFAEWDGPLLPGGDEPASLSGEVDPALSAEMRVRFASCLQLPVDSVELEVDADRRVLHTQWVDNIGDGPARTVDDCLDRLELQRPPSD